MVCTRRYILVPMDTKQMDAIQAPTRLLPYLRVSRRLPFEERICCSEETSDGNTVAACANLCHAGIDSCGREGLDQETTISIVVIFVIVMGLAGLVACVLARWRETERKTERKTPDTQRINSVSVETG